MPEQDGESDGAATIRSHVHFTATPPDSTPDSTPMHEPALIVDCNDPENPSSELKSESENDVQTLSSGTFQIHNLVPIAPLTSSDTIVDHPDGDDDLNNRVRTIPLESQSAGLDSTLDILNDTKSLARPMTAEGDLNDSAAFDSLDESTQTVRRNNTGRTRPVRGSMRGLLLEPDADLSREYLDGPVSWKQPGSVVRKVRWLSGSFVENPKVQVAIIGLIVINAIMMGIATFSFVEDHRRTFRAFEIVDNILLAIFTIELALQFAYRSMKLFLDPWLVFDFVIIVASWSTAGTQVIRAFRIFRAVRLVTRIGPLRELISAIGAVMPRMYAITMLLMLIFYIYAVLFTELFSELELSRDYFGTLTQSLFTCMELMTMQWADVTREVMEQKHWAWAPFTSFIALSGFIVFNLIVAVVCDAVAVIDRAAKEERDGPQESDANKLLEAHERIFELSNQVAAMQSQHSDLCRAMGLLTNELQYALATLHTLDTDRTRLPNSMDEPKPPSQPDEDTRPADLLGDWPSTENET